MFSSRPIFCVGFALLVMSILFGTGCSLVLNLEQCVEDSDCADQGEQTVCSDDGLCQTPVDTTIVHEECGIDADCEQFGVHWTCSDDGHCSSPDAPSTCESEDDCDPGMECNELGTCQQPSDIFGGPCNLGAGDIDDDNAFVIGILLPLTGPEEGFGRPLFNAINLAMADFNSVGGVGGRSIALLACDTEGDDALAIAGAEHLADVGIPAVIGPDYSNQTIDVATSVTIDAEMVLVSPSATAAAISFIDDNGLVWRTVASDTVQGAANGQLINFLLEERPQYTDIDAEFIPDEPRLAVLQRGQDPYASGLVDALFEELPPGFGRDSEAVTVRDYTHGEDYAGFAAEIIAETGDSSTGMNFGPDVIAIIGSSEAWTLAEYFDSIFDNPPVFVFADAARNSERAAEASSFLQGRVWGTAPQNVGDIDYSPYTRYRLRYQEVYGENPNNFQFSANAFDALYILGLGASFGGFTGPGIAEGMTRLSDPEAQSFDPHPTDGQQAMNLLSGGGTIGFRGASGPLNFDANGDPQSSPTILWCFDDAGLPEVGVILDADHLFTPRICELDNNFCLTSDDCSAFPENGSPHCSDDNRCTYACDPDFEDCNGECVNTEIDPNHCGICNRQCDSIDATLCELGDCIDAED